MLSRRLITRISSLSLVGVLLGAPSVLMADGHGKDNHDKPVCEGFGPQTPRDIDNLEGSNGRLFSMPPGSSQMNLCNIHFHNNAEHKAKDFSIAATGDENGMGGGFQCAISQSLSKSELKSVKGGVCGGIQPGETVEVHWVFSSCDVAPGPGLGSCLSDSCANPDLRVETQVFTVVNDSNAMDFGDLDYAGKVNDAGLHQPKNQLPNNTGKPVEFLGSTTGPAYTQQKCSPLQVGWSVRPQCAKVDIKTLGKWCEKNVFTESKAHGVRKLVTHPSLLSDI